MFMHVHKTVHVAYKNVGLNIHLPGLVKVRVRVWTDQPIRAQELLLGFNSWQKKTLHELV